VVADRLDMQAGTINNFLRVFENLDADVAKKCRKASAPMRNMVLWAGITGKGRTEDAKAESQAQQQMEAFEEWFKAKTELEESGRKKKPRKRRSPRDRLPLKSEVEGGGGDDDVSMVNKTKTELLGACIDVLKLKLEASNAAERGPIQGRIEALRFVTGDLKKLPGVTKADLDSLVEEPEEAEEAEEEEATEE